MDWLGDNQWAAWLALAIGLGVAEMFSLDLILIMVAVGAIAGMLTGVLGAPFLLQVLVAAGASIAMLALVRPNMIKRLHTGPDLQLGTASSSGSEASSPSGSPTTSPGG